VALQGQFEKETPFGIPGATVSAGTRYKQSPKWEFFGGASFRNDLAAITLDGEYVKDQLDPNQSGPKAAQVTAALTHSNFSVGGAVNLIQDNKKNEEPRISAGLAYHQEKISGQLTGKLFADQRTVDLDFYHSPFEDFSVAINVGADFASDNKYQGFRASIGCKEDFEHETLKAKLSLKQNEKKKIRLNLSSEVTVTSNVRAIIGASVNVLALTDSNAEGKPHAATLALILE